MKKNIFILSGVSGSGKSFVADLLQKSLTGNTVIACADDFFMNGDSYEFDYLQIGEAHRQCWKTFMEGVEDDSTTNVIIANTNTSEKEYKRYLNVANERGFNCVRLIVDNIHSNNDVHNVPVDVKASQLERLKNSIH